jgi:hypothetical protein
VEFVNPCLIASGTVAACRNGGTCIRLTGTSCYIEQIEQQQSIEIHVQINKNERFNREKLRYIMSLADELSQMFD